MSDQPKSIEELFGKDFAATVGEELDQLPAAPAPLLPQGVQPPECTFCDKPAVYILDRILLEVKTNEGAHHTIETILNKQTMIAACVGHKDNERDQEVAEGAHASVIHETHVHSELVHYEVYWRLL